MTDFEDWEWNVYHQMKNLIYHIFRGGFVTYELRVTSWKFNGFNLRVTSYFLRVAVNFTSYELLFTSWN